MKIEIQIPIPKTLSKQQSITLLNEIDETYNSKYKFTISFDNIIHYNIVDNDEKIFLIIVNTKDLTVQEALNKQFLIKQIYEKNYNDCDFIILASNFEEMQIIKLTRTEKEITSHITKWSKVLETLNINKHFYDMCALYAEILSNDTYCKKYLALNMKVLSKLELKNVNLYHNKYEIETIILKENINNYRGLLPDNLENIIDNVSYLVLNKIQDKLIDELIIILNNKNIININKLISDVFIMENDNVFELIVKCELDK